MIRRADNRYGGGDGGSGSKGYAPSPESVAVRLLHAGTPASAALDVRSLSRRLLDYPREMSSPALSLRRLPRRAALVALGVTLGAGALVAAALAGLGVWVPRLDMSPQTLAVVAPLATAALAGAAGVWWWASRYTRQVRHAVEASEQVLRDRAERTLMEASQRNAYAAVGDFATELARELAPSVATARTSIRTLESARHLDSPLRAPLERAQRELNR